MSWVYAESCNWDKGREAVGQRKRGAGHGENVGLLGRASECAVLDQMIAAVRMGESRVLVVHGAPGVGKSALLEYAENSAAGMRVLRAVGVESEMELAFATLHQLCAPLLDRLEHLPAPQRDALERVFGMRGGTPPERFLVGLAVLSLLSDVSEGNPLLCVIDDAQWMDRSSAQVLGFVARRLLAESVALVFGSRRRAQELLGLPELEVTGLKDADAHALLDSVTHVRIDQHIRDRFVAETRGNPLALLELPRELAVTQMAGGSGLLDADTLPSRIEQSFMARIEGLPEQTRLFLLIAAAEPVGDPSLVWRAAERLGVMPATVLASGTDGLLEFDVRVIFRHPLVRSAVYRSAKEGDRRAVHLALAEVTDAQADPDRRAWHLASATAAPDETVAAELERSAGRAQARGGLAAAAAFLQRSVALTIDTSRRAERALTAADASLRAGDIDAARRFVDIADRDALTEFQRVRAHLTRGHITFAAGFNDEAPLMLLAAAHRLEPFDMDLARETYLIAWASASFGAGNRDSLMAISRAMRELPSPEGSPRALDLVMEGYALLVTDGRSAALPTLRRAKTALTDHPVQDFLKWGWAACGVSALIWEDRIMPETPARAVEEVRTAGALSELPIYLHALGIPVSLSGDFAAGAAIVVEADAVAEATHGPMTQHTKLLLTAMQGKEAEASALIAATIEEAGASGQLNGVASAQWAAAVLYNGLARYGLALPAAQATIQSANLIVSQWALPELVEAAARVGDDTAALWALEGLANSAETCDTDWAQGILARCRALLSDDAAADDLYREAIERLGRTILRPEQARAHLLYGEWLRRDRQRAEARIHLRTAYEMFVSIGMEAFAERARRELLATGETVRKRRNEASTSDELTAQETQIALLVRDGLSNPEVGARLFLSPRTVEWHLRKIFAKLGISSRRQLGDALSRGEYESMTQ
ncbi:AAA family ATPase [Planotetraspora thailandica]|uniref:ATP-binding protein n=1 Tax=Planotetraspora thailandica TaxID=487172 RepID=UPI0027E4703D|nr:AAA family ATPase [Planotetraspora thailandica]